jgi:hypothetical protein
LDAVRTAHGARRRAPNALYIVLDDVLGAFAIAGAPLFVGRQVGEPVTDDYAGAAPYGFTGGTLHRVGVDVSGEPYVDLARQAEMIMRSR